MTRRWDVSSWTRWSHQTGGWGPNITFLDETSWEQLAVSRGTKPASAEAAGKPDAALASGRITTKAAAIGWDQSAEPCPDPAAKFAVPSRRPQWPRTRGEASWSAKHGTFPRVQLCVDFSTIQHQQV